jgi:multidrug resistance efflux pump
MTHKRALRIVPAVVVLSLIGAGAYYWQAQSSTIPGSLSASGTVEATQILIGPEMAGRVAEVLVSEGDSVRAGDVLLRLDDQGLMAQRDGVVAAGKAAQSAAQAELDAAEQALSDLHEQAPVVTALAEQTLANARKALDDAQKRNTWQQTGNRASRDTIDATEARLTLAKDAVDKAQAAFNHVEDKDPEDPVRAQAEANLLAARQNRDDIVRLLNWYKGSPTDIDQAILDANVAVAEAQVAQAQIDYDKVKNGPDPDAVKLAQDRIDAARAQLESAAAQTEAQLTSIDLQLDKLAVKAPSDGVVLNRGVEPGETVTPGSVAMTVGLLDSLKLTVFLPEDRYGQINLGDTALVTVDSYPGVDFSGTVTQIADQAEFTPRNVQTEEGRKTTVFAVELKLSDAQSRLKPGMPADVVFELN